MADPDASRKLEALLQVSRSEVKAALVEAVQVQVLATEEKIQRIEMIDLLAEAAPKPVGPTKPRGSLVRPHAPVPESPTPNPDPPAEVLPLEEPSRRERASVELARRSLGLSSRMGSWLGYFATEYSSLMHFGVDSGTLRKHWLPFRLKFSDDFKVFLSTTLPDQVLPPLQAGLPAVLKRAWSVLPKLDYNLLVALNTLVQLTASVRAPTVARTSRAWFGLLDPVVTSLVLFRTSAGLPRRTLQAWNQSCLKLGLPDGQRSAGSESIRTLLESRSDQISLPESVRALFSLRCRRVVGLAEFYPDDGGDYFCRDSFDAAPDVQADLDKALDQFDAQLAGLEKESLDVLRVSYFVPSGETLTRFFPADDALDPGPWAVGFLDLVELTYRPLLTGTISLVTGESVTLFRNEALVSSLDRLATLKEQLLDPAQAKKAAPVHDVARVLIALGKTLVVLIRNRSRWGEALIRAADPENLTDPLPHEQVKLEAPAAWAGLTVIEALVECARVSFLAGRFLGDTTLDATMDKGKTLAKRASELLHQVSHLATPTQLMRAKARWSSLMDAPQEDE
ncbi:MAG: hypothetical protein WCG80_12725 [Spirochaetales bacterium]